MLPLSKKLFGATDEGKLRKFRVCWAFHMELRIPLFTGNDRFGRPATIIKNAAVVEQAVRGNRRRKTKEIS
ncbi:hypothetical protein NPIL_455441, partial [Nephila pilipes]